jgi:hypothetical protein
MIGKVKNIHVKFRSMTHETWQSQGSKSKSKFLKRSRNGLSLDYARTNFHNKLSGDNSSDMLFLLSLYSSELFLPKSFITQIKIIPDVSDIQDYFYRCYWEIRKIWHDEYPANILFTGADVIFISPVDFSQISGFQMFNYAKSTPSHRSRTGTRNLVLGGNPIFDQYFNCDVRYFSHDLDRTLWSIGDSWAKNWVKGIWEYEQDLYNAMIRTQESKSILIIPEFAYQAPVTHFEDQKYLFGWNHLSIENAKLVHLHSSRSPRKALELAKNLIFEKLNENNLDQPF